VQKSFNLKGVQNNARMNMTRTDDSMGMILDDILKEYASDGDKLLDSALNEEIRMMVKARLADAFLERLKVRLLNKLKTSKEIEWEFEDTVLITWKKPLELLDLLLNICLEVSNDFISKSEIATSSNRNHVQEALVKQQANACLVFNEILHLLKSGFPIGANSLWRTLHEIACVSYFISEHGDDVAKRFLDYETVEIYFQAEAVSKHQQNIECSSLSERDIKSMKKEVAALKKTYGADYTKKSNYPYGWIPRTVMKTRSLKELERSVKLDVFRPYYDLAGYNVLSGQNGLIFTLGIMKSKKKRLIMPVGPTNYGLGEPGKSSAISLGQITSSLLLTENGIKKQVIIEALRNLVDEICDAFSKIEAEFGR
jgi:hypothetical protein